MPLCGIAFVTVVRASYESGSHLFSKAWDERLQHQRPKKNRKIHKPNFASDHGVFLVILDDLEEPTGPLYKADMDFFVHMEDAMTIPPGDDISESFSK